MTFPSVFGVVHLGYIVIETEWFTDWRRFGTDAIGMHRDDLDTGVMRFRFERIEARIWAHGVPLGPQGHRRSAAMSTPSSTPASPTASTRRSVASN
jgi:hypothetical protein